MSASLRERLRELAKPYAIRAYGASDGSSDYDAIAIAAAKLALADYAERMEKAGQPAAALGAILLAEKECS